ncbi:hypothetical protein [Marinobacter nauticus]|uniref:hypothetical protein n=1 Tax=Marinobacter nauticus TaxID=2743 RepID=UPI001C978C32|nr:hypothetical protein [Marinobacter nauticus]MBY6102329.1 hypothetical protein [Marinobacter nauticus]
MKNESSSEMWDELKSSKLKMIFMIFLVVGGLTAVFSKSVEIPGLRAEHINLSYDQMMEQIYLSGLTSAQEADKKSQFVGKRVTWMGTVIDVEPGYRGNTIELSDGNKRSLADYFLEEIPDDQALSLSLGDVIRFTGTIDRFTDGVLTGYVHLTDVDLK